MTHKQKLIDLLKSDKEVGETIEELEFWCKIQLNKEELIKMFNNKIYCLSTEFQDELRELVFETIISEVIKEIKKEVEINSLNESYVKYAYMNEAFSIIKIRAKELYWIKL